MDFTVLNMWGVFLGDIVEFGIGDNELLFPVEPVGNDILSYHKTFELPGLAKVPKAKS